MTALFLCFAFTLTVVIAVLLIGSIEHDGLDKYLSDGE